MAPALETQNQCLLVLLGNWSWTICWELGGQQDLAMIPMTYSAHIKPMSPIALFVFLQPESHTERKRSDIKQAHQRVVGLKGWLCCANRCQNFAPPQNLLPVTSTIWHQKDANCCYILDHFNSLKSALSCLEIWSSSRPRFRAALATCRIVARPDTRWSNVSLRGVLLIYTHENACALSCTDCGPKWSKWFGIPGLRLHLHLFEDLASPSEAGSCHSSAISSFVGWAQRKKQKIWTLDLKIVSKRNFSCWLWCAFVYQSCKK